MVPLFYMAEQWCYWFTLSLPPPPPPPRKPPLALAASPLAPPSSNPPCPCQVEAWLRESGLPHFALMFAALGVDSLDDMLDPSLVGDDELQP